AAATSALSPGPSPADRLPDLQGAHGHATINEVRMRRRCAWANGDAAMLRYHDEEWGVPVHDDRRLFELLILESAQAGLSWATILKKREAYRRAFDGFEPARVARFGARRIRQLLGDAGIVRNRAKIEAAVANARAVLAVLALVLTAGVAAAGGSNYGIAPGARPQIEGRISEWKVPTPQFARDPAPGPDGSIYIAVMFGNKIARFDPRAKTFTEWDLPA